MCLVRQPLRVTSFRLLDLVWDLLVEGAILLGHECDPLRHGKADFLAGSTWRPREPARGCDTWSQFLGAG